MKKTRVKKSLTPALVTREDAEARMNDLAQAQNFLIALRSDMDAEILTVKARFEEGIGEAQDIVKQYETQLQDWAIANPDLFQKPKSIAFLSGSIGFRTGTPKLVLGRGWTWEKSLLAIQQNGFAFVRSKDEVDKEAILAFCASEQDKVRLDTHVLKPIGIRLVQDEGVWIEPNLTSEAAAR
jgi:phage host-nuclease inhibitor protein Gam